MKYIDKIFTISKDYLNKSLTKKEITKLWDNAQSYGDLNNKEVVKRFSKDYKKLMKEKHQNKYKRWDKDLMDFIDKKNGKAKVVWDDCLNSLKGMKNESIQLMVTSPPYYNARDYSQWKNLNDYLKDMKAIIKESYRVLDNHRIFVFNVGDITGNDNLHTKSAWGDRRIPLGAYFTKIFEDVGFTFIDDFIWDKGEVQSHRNKNGGTPLYQYPINCYEHIMVFAKHREDKNLYPCPVCGCLKVNGNAYAGVGIKSWECKNLECFERSKSNRGKRFSYRSVMMDELKSNKINPDLMKRWRRDIVKLNPTIKINSKGENKLGHTAPYPHEIAEFAIEFFSGEGENVLDPFAGSFTTIIEAIKKGRNGIGIELNKDMFADAIYNKLNNHLTPFDEHERQGQQKSNRTLRRDALGNGTSRKRMASI